MAQNFPWLSTYEALGKQWHSLPDISIKTLSCYIRDHSHDFSDRTALVYLGHRISYRALNEMADRLANYLLAQGFTAGDVMGIHLPNTPQYVVALVAASRIGMVVTSLSPLMTASEITHVANDAGVKVIITLDSLFKTVISNIVGQISSLQAVLVSSASELLPDGPVANVESKDLTQLASLTHALNAATAAPVFSDISVHDVHYLQYTGGTTGKPKGAQLSSHNIFTNNLQADVFYGYRLGQEVVASAFPMFHIGGAAVMFNALRMAATFIVVPDPRNIEQFCSEMRNHPPTVIANVPALFQMLVNSPLFRDLDFSQLRIAVSGAAPFAEEEIKRLEEVIGKGKFCEVYGMTETSPIQTLNPAGRFKPGYVGVPVPGTEVRIVDVETGTREMPLGEPGEIIVSGPQVMRGYFAMPDATEKALRQFQGKTWMYTGDIGFMDEDGYVKVCDRSKDMLIVGGYKVFSVEVESKLRELDFIEQCAVVGRPDPARPGNEIVQLYVQLRGKPALTEEELKQRITQFCRENMSPYKVPKEIFFIEAIPLTSVGKIDKKALRQA
ncbi:MAG TPA: AMP-binding protein [Pseudomonadales bacterium]|nr:AMP-binding protein [Pseudomonadales bacterium]